MSSRCDGTIILIIYLFPEVGEVVLGGAGWGASFCRSSCARVPCSRHSSNEQRRRYDQRRRTVSAADVCQPRVSARRSLYQAGERCLRVCKRECAHMRARLYLSFLVCKINQTGVFLGGRCRCLNSNQTCGEPSTRQQIHFSIKK